MKYNLVVLMCGVLAATSVKALPAVTLTQMNNDQNLINYLMTSNALSSTIDPAISTACFAQYLPQLNDIATAFSTAYNLCINITNEKITALNIATELSRSTLTANISTICSAYDTCNNDADDLTFFNCYATESTSSIGNIYDISNQAAAAATQYSESMQQITDYKNSCTTTAEQNYVTSTASTYQMLDSCLAGDSTSTTTTPVPTTTTTTSPTTTTTTPEPTTTTTPTSSTSTTTTPEPTTTTTTGAPTTDANGVSVSA